MSRREEIRNYLKMQSDGASTGRIAEALCCTNDQARDALKNMRERGEVCKDDMGRWYWNGRSGFVPEGATVRREPVVKMPLAALEEKVDIQTLPMPEPTELGKVSVVPEAELEKAVPEVEHLVEIRLTVPVSVARRILLMV